MRTGWCSKLSALLGGVGLVALLARPVQAQSVTLYATDFESPAFVPGLLHGQGGFAAYLGRNSNVVRVASTFPSYGVQHLILDSALLGQYGTNPNRRAVYIYPTLNYLPLANNRPVIVAQVDVALVKRNNTYLPVGYQVYTIAGDGIAGFQVDTDGDVVVYNFGSLPSDEILVPGVAFGKYHTFTTRINYAIDQIDFFLNGDYVGRLPMDPLAESTLGDVDIFASTVIPAGGVQPDSVGYFDNYIVKAVTQDRVLVTGRVTLEGCENAAGTLARFEFRPTTGSPVTRNVKLTAQGTFTLEDIPPGTYSVAVKTPKHLQKVLTGVTVSGAFRAGLRVALLAGDANDDNSVDVFDLAVLIDSFDSAAGDPNWNDGAADFNCDGAVDVLDLALLIQNFDLSGDA
ncbi:MAG: dockerin type I domain-containing protein [Chloroherpetonaceae bacterium]|nr:dockerin type I domain-containing protein [Chthonomonadaceae bacterium]MDW8209052.1 dockerin type I domain-containing protein [Chloroherpetonaceae bacterium]